MVIPFASPVVDNPYYFSESHYGLPLVYQPQIGYYYRSGPPPYFPVEVLLALLAIQTMTPCRWSIWRWQTWPPTMVAHPVMAAHLIMVVHLEMLIPPVMEMAMLALEW